MIRTLRALTLAVGLSGMAASATVAAALAPLDTLNGALVQVAHADPSPYLPGGARDVVLIDPAPAGPAITVYLSNGAVDTLKPCRYEDGRHCYWDASERRNGIGRDVIVTRGRVHFVDIDHMIRTFEQLA